MTTIANISGRATLIRDGRGADVERLSQGRFSSEVQGLYSRWDEFLDWAVDAPFPDSAEPVAAGFDTPVPDPKQIIAVGINYPAKLEEYGLGLPTDVGVIAKFRSALAGPHDPIALVSDAVIAEAEIAIVIKKQAFRVTESEAPSYVAGAALSLDLANPAGYVRIPARDGGEDAFYPNPGKSHPGFAPIGPFVASADEFSSLQELDLTFRINGELVQRGNTRDAIFSVSEIVARLSRSITLYPGDVILTGSPGQLEGSSLAPLKLGDVLEAASPGLGSQRHVLVDSGVPGGEQPEVLR